MKWRIVAPVAFFLAFILMLPQSNRGEEPKPKEGQKLEELTTEAKFTVRYPGTRWYLVYGSYAGIEHFAVNELERAVQSYFPYIVEVRPASEALNPKAHPILVGTSADNRWIAELGSKGLLKLPTKPQSYTMACLKSPWSPGHRVAVIAGADAPGVLYGVEDFNRKIMTLDTTPNDGRTKREIFDAMADFQTCDAPVIENRGLWTWGFVIYDYRRFSDHMARLKMNRLIVWNDHPPVNGREFIAYAHSRGIKVILGSHWGWGIPKLDPTNPEHLKIVKEDVLRRYEKEYRPLGMDGIYFQTFTEQSNQVIGGKTIAALACEWVNEVARALLEKYPGLRIEFGLHASSIREHYTDFKLLDPRLTIVWEDAGVMPYAYDPVIEFPPEQETTAPRTVDATIEYSKKIATFRAKNEFAMVAKGWTTLRWRTEFENHGPFILGERLRSFTRDRRRERQSRWDYINTQWVKHFPQATRFYREIRKSTPNPMTVVGLIEDGLFEEQIQVSAALLGEMLWNPYRGDQEILERALTPYSRSVE